MSNTQNIAKAKQCKGTIIESGYPRQRLIDEITLVVKNGVPKKLTGETLPDSLILNTGDSQQAKTVLEFFYEKAPAQVVNKVFVERSPGLNGRDVVAGIVAVALTGLGLAVFNAVRTALSLE